MGARILIVDDERNIRLMLRTTLASEGYEISEASSGTEALERVRELSPALAIVDLNMPEMDGMALLSQFKLLPPQQRPHVIVLTAFGSIPLAVQATHLGASDFLEKPVMPADLRLSVACVLSEPLEPAPEPEGATSLTLAHVRLELLRGDVGRAEVLLMRAAEAAGKDPAYFNLLGVVYETEGRRLLAKKCYAKAVASDRHYAPAANNLRRLAEIETNGKSHLEVCLGNEAILMQASAPAS